MKVSTGISFLEIVFASKSYRKIETMYNIKWLAMLRPLDSSSNSNWCVWNVCLFREFHFSLWIIQCNDQSIKNNTLPEHQCDGIGRRCNSHTEFFVTEIFCELWTLIRPKDSIFNSILHHFMVFSKTFIPYLIFYFYSLYSDH